MTSRKLLESILWDNIGVETSSTTTHDKVLETRWDLRKTAKTGESYESVLIFRTPDVSNH